MGVITIKRKNIKDKGARKLFDLMFDKKYQDKEAEDQIKKYGYHKSWYDSLKGICDE